MAPTVTLAAHALLTEAEAKVWARLPTTPSDGEIDAIRTILNAITLRVENYRGGQVIGTSRPVTERTNGNGKYYIHLRQFPVLSVTSIKIYGFDGSVLHTYDVTVNEDYRITDTGRLVLIAQPWFQSGDENIEVVYTPGWAATPEDLKLAAAQWTVDWFRTWQKEREPIQSVSLNGQTTTFFNEEIPKKVRAVLDMYRLPGTGLAA